MSIKSKRRQVARSKATSLMTNCFDDYAIWCMNYWIESKFQMQGMKAVDIKRNPVTDKNVIIILDERDSCYYEVDGENTERGLMQLLCMMAMLHAGDPYGFDDRCRPVDLTTEMVLRENGMIEYGDVYWQVPGGIVVALDEYNFKMIRMRQVDNEMSEFVE